MVIVLCAWVIPFYSTIQEFKMNKNSQKFVTIEISILNILQPFYFDD
jgi:hypothetical protein